MWKQTAVHWMVLSFLVHYVHAQNISTTTNVTTELITSTKPATIVLSPVTMVITQHPTSAARATLKENISVPPSTAANMKEPTKVSGITILTTPTPTTQKPSTPSASEGAVQPPSITTVSKLQQQPASTTPKSADQSTPSKVRATTLDSITSLIPGTTPRLTEVQTTAPKGQTQTPDTKTPMTTENQATRVTPSVTNLPVAASTKQAGKDDKGAAGTPTVTHKPSPDQDQGSTLPPGTSPPQTSSKAPAAVTQVPSLITTKFRVQTRIQTTSFTFTTETIPSTEAAQKIFSFSLNSGLQPGEQKDLVTVCRQLMSSYEDGNCTLTYRNDSGRMQIDAAWMSGKVKPSITRQAFDDISKKPTNSQTLITILASCGALLLMILILAVCASHHRKSYSENQRPLTDELQAVENGYHDNPTLEVMEAQGAEPEKKMALNLNGEFNDSWIVPMDNLLKEEGPDEEDTHL
ncbi:podocalyxin [Periophthalmus magnuspinnatus]|uniref:podocalyxin n=1 Tax=Periophthalmus magnuspinnatus TaxID=409849 RepID=UPI0024365597|nr:podocalyxin [Periophthalmus magnuspinnatus]